MSRPSGVTVVGVSQLTRALTALGLDVEDLKGAFRALAAEGARVATGFTPKRSGALAATVRGASGKNKASVVVGGGRVRYAAVINYGWPAHRISASSFKARTDKAMGPRVVPLLDAEIEQDIKRRGLG